MKKYILGLILIIVLAVIGWLIVRFMAAPEVAETPPDQTNESVSTLKPWEVTVGIYDPQIDPSQLTKLLESRLKELGFEVVIISELVDPSTAEQEKTTILHRSDTAEELKVVTDNAVNSSLYRTGQNEAIEQSVLISAWNIEDINWGSFSDLAEKYNNPEPADISIVVLNNGAAAGAAGALVATLQAAGYEQALAESADAEQPASQPVLIYHQRNYKNAAQDLRRFLLDLDYSKVSYRVDLEQAANIIIVLGPQATSTPALESEVNSE